MSDAPLPLATLSAEQLKGAGAQTLRHYDEGARSFRHGTLDHDVSQNVAALLRHLPESAQHTILDFGCGPGRDLATFRGLSHLAVGLDGAENFVQMARDHSGCEVLHQDFLHLDLPTYRRFMMDAQFVELEHYYRPTGKPRHLQPWLASVWRKPE